MNKTKFFFMICVVSSLSLYGAASKKGIIDIGIDAGMSVAEQVAAHQIEGLSSDLIKQLPDPLQKKALELIEVALKKASKIASKAAKKAAKTVAGKVKEEVSELAHDVKEHFASKDEKKEELSAQQKVTLNAEEVLGIKIRLLENLFDDVDEIGESKEVSIIKLQEYQKALDALVNEKDVVAHCARKEKNSQDLNHNIDEKRRILEENIEIQKELISKNAEQAKLRKEEQERKLVEERLRIENEERIKKEQEEKERAEKERIEKEERLRLENECIERERKEKEEKIKQEEERLKKDEEERLFREEEERVERERKETEDKRKQEEERLRVEEEIRRKEDEEWKERIAQERIRREEEERLEKEEEDRLRVEEENKRKQEEERKAQDLIDKGKPPVINPDPNAKQPYSLVKKGAVTVGILCGLYELYSIAKQYKKVCHEAIENEALQNKNLFLVALGRECARWKDPCAGFLWSNAEDDEAAEKEKIAEKETDAEEGA